VERGEGCSEARYGDGSVASSAILGTKESTGRGADRLGTPPDPFVHVHADSPPGESRAEGTLKYRLHRQRTLNAESLPVLHEILPGLREGGFGLDLILSDTEFNRDVPFRQLEGLRRALADESIPLTCHLPYVDLHFGSRDPKVHEYARDCLQYGLEMAADLRAKIAVMHIGYSNHIPPRRKGEWRDRVVDSLQEIVRAAEEEETFLALENTYEPDGDVLRDILETVNSPWLRFCADLGHAACFSRMAPEEWIESFKDKIVMLHFHDNDGQDDLHQACGEGVVGYEPVFEACKAADLACVITIEVDDEAWEPSVEHLRQVGFEFGEIPEPVV
jgi:sugar phosphate isomerase/epimerase